MKLLPQTGFQVSILVLALTGVGVARAQGPSLRFEPIAFEGDESPIIYDICEDGDGFLWLASGSGVHRYNYEETQSYQEETGGVPSQGVRAVYFSPGGDLWAGTDFGLAWYNRDWDRFETITLDGTGANEPEPDVRDILEDDQGNLWIATMDALYFGNPRQRINGRLPVTAFPPETLTSTQVRSLAFDLEGFLWAATSNGLNRINIRSHEVRQFLHDPENPESMMANQINVVFGDSKGDVWVGYYAAGMDRFDPKTQTFQHFRPDQENPHSINSRGVRGIAEDPSGDIWVATWNGGVNQLHRDTGEFSHFLSQPADPFSVVDNRVMTVYTDRQGLLWVGSFLGLQKNDPLQRPFVQFRHQPGNPDGLKSNRMMAAMEDSRGRVWIGTYDAGASVYDPKTGRFTNFEKDSSNPRALESSGVFDIIEDQKKRIWLGSGKALFLYDEASQDFTRFPIGSPEVSVTRLLADKDGSLWVGTWQGGLRKLGADLRYERTYTKGSEGNEQLSGNTVTDLLQTREGDLFVVTDQGLDRLMPGTESFQTVEAGQKLIALSIFQDSRGRLWLGTDVGIAQLFEDGQFTQFELFDKGSQLKIHTFQESQDGSLWLGSNGGLVRWHPDTKEVHVFQVRDGIPSNRFGMVANKGADGRLYFFGNDGMVAFYPNELRLNQHPPKPAITQFLLANKLIQPEENTLLPKAINALEAMTLTHRQNHITFGFTALETRQPEQTQYAYRLVPFDDTWINTDARFRRATYTGLPAGRYQFQVKAANDDGVWSSEVASIDVRMLPPLWKTWWAYALYALAFLLALSYFAISQRRKVLREQAINQQLRRVDRLKDEFLANTSHELRTPLHGIVGLSEALLEGVAGQVSQPMRQQLVMIASSGKRLTNLVNDILDFSKLKNSQLPLACKAVDARIAAESVLRLCQPLIDQKNLELRNDISPDCRLVFADEDRLQQILLNLVGNAIKFSDEGIVRVSAEPWAAEPGDPVSHLAITISDQGPGIAEDQLQRIFQPFEQLDGSATRNFGGTGLGLGITQALVALHGGQIWVNTTPGQGSQFSFTLPLAVGSVKTVTTSHIPEAPLLPLSRDTSLQIAPTLIGQANGKHVLVVDDEQVNRQILVNFLEMAGYTVTTAENGGQALRLIDQQTPFDLVVLDIMMPKMSGYEVCQKIRETYPASALPVILLTAKTQEADMLNGFDAGANDYVTKPFSKETLLKRLQLHLELSKIHLAAIRFVPFEFLKILGKERITDVQLGDHCMRSMTVLFADIRAYTTLAESIGPAESFAFLNNFLGRMGPEIKKHGGFVNQYFGDGIMAIFPDNAQSAVQAAVDMHLALEIYNQERGAKGRAPIQIGIGIHSGPLTLGIIGDQVRMDTGVVADTVNTAARMESFTKTYGASIIMSETTHTALISSSLQFRRLDRVRAKGKTTFLDLYEVYSADREERITAKVQTESRFREGVSAWVQSHFASAAQAFQEVLATDPADSAASFLLAKAEIELEKNSKTRQ